MTKLYSKNNSISTRFSQDKGKNSKRTVLGGKAKCKQEEACSSYKINLLSRRLS